MYNKGCIKSLKRKQTADKTTAFSRKVRIHMTRFCRRFIELSFFLFITAFLCTLSVYATEGCVHNYIEIERHEATCSARGGITYLCTECQDVKVDYFGSELPHTWETITETQPTCTESGSIVRRCTVCETEETVPSGTAKGHQLGEVMVKAPTCSEEGYIYRTCNECGEIEIDEGSYTPTSDHHYEATPSTEPTCQYGGYTEYICKDCGDSYLESVPSVDHDYTAEVTAPTHTDQGYTTYTCNFCGMVTFDDYTEPKPYDMAYTVTEPTCTENGLKVGVCKDGCLHTESEVLLAVGHSFGEGEDEGWTKVREASAELNGLEQRICAVCGVTESRSINYVEPEPEPARQFSATLLICIVFALILLVGVTVAVLLIVLEHTGHKNNRKYALLTAVDKALAEQKNET